MLFFSLHLLNFQFQFVGSFKIRINIFSGHTCCFLSVVHRGCVQDLHSILLLLNVIRRRRLMVWRWQILSLNLLWENFLIQIIHILVDVLSFTRRRLRFMKVVNFRRTQTNLGWVTWILKCHFLVLILIFPLWIRFWFNYI